VQFIDARDLARWMLDMTEATNSGTYNATGPASPLSVGNLLQTCKNVTTSDARFTWVDDAFLLDEKVEPYSELPLWLPAEYATMESFDCQKAIAAGLAFRPLEETVRDTLDWARAYPVLADKGGVSVRGSISETREQELLERWKARA
jgi:2'-hydroxyisoflavone reductase